MWGWGRWNTGTAKNKSSGPLGHFSFTHYRYLIGLSDYSARKDLAALVASGRLVKGGSRLFAIYTLPKEEDMGIPQPLVVDSNLPG